MNETVSQTKGRFQANPSSASSILQRKCACGNHTVAGGECAECAKSKNGLQPKLAIGASIDPLEREADRVADQVIAASINSNVSSVPPRIQRFAGQLTGQADAPPPSVDRALASSGAPLEPVLRQDMEQRFGHDFSQVRAHTGDAGEQSARDVSAHAYTVGRNIVFAAGQFAPGTQKGRRLIAHELTHVVQQTHSNGIRADQSYEKRALSPVSILQRKPRTDDEKKEKAERRAKRREERAERRAKRREERAGIVKFEGNILIEPGVLDALELARTMLDSVSLEFLLRGFPANLYYGRFGQSPGSLGGFADRTTGDLYPTLEEATKKEMEEIGQRFSSMSLFMMSDFEFLFPTLGNTVQLDKCGGTKCKSDTFAIVCGYRTPRVVVICPTFYKLSRAQQAGVLIHEIGHKALKLWKDFDTLPYAASFNERFAETECLTSLVADRFGFKPPDPSCPPLPP